MILGVSLDDVKSHEEFAKKYSLPFSLLADTDGTVAGRYDVLNRLIGRIKLAKRQTFLIGPDGRLVKHLREREDRQHSAEVLADLKALGAGKGS